MPIEIKMPALSPTMEEGTLAKWLVKEGDSVKSGDLLAEIETDKATMEFEAVDEGTIVSLSVAAGTDGVKVGTVIAMLAEEGEEAGAGAGTPAGAAEPVGDTVSEASSQQAAKADVEETIAAKAGETALSSSVPPGGSARLEQGGDAPSREDPVKPPATSTRPASSAAGTAPTGSDGNGDARLRVSPLARRIAADKGVDLSAVSGSGPNGRIVKADIESAAPAATPAKAAAPAAPAPAVAPAPTSPAPATAPAPAKTSPLAGDIPHVASKLSNIRKVIARRLTESKQTVPHIYLTVDIRLDALLQLRTDLNASLAPRGVKLSVNDLMIKALAVSLLQVPKCNVMFTPDQLVSFTRADISVAVSTPSGLITPIVVDAGTKGVAAISTEMKDLAARARDGKLQPPEYQGGTASLSNMGMYGIQQFDAVINPPQAMILAIGAGEPRPHVVDGALGVATVMSATGSFDHRAIDGADGAQLMQALKSLVEAPLGLLV